MRELLSRKSSFRGALLLCALIALSGCHSLFGNDEKDADKPKVEEGKRISILEVVRKDAPDSSVADLKPVFPDPSLNKAWPQAGGDSSHSVSNPALSALPEEIWSSSLGEGSNGDFKLLVPPVVEGGRIFTMDARGKVRAFDLAEGDRLWSFDTTPDKADTQEMGGGVAVGEGVVFATTGFGEVLALNAADGKLLWRKLLGKPLRSPPSLTRKAILAVSLDNELSALSRQTGEVLWHHNGMPESASLLGASSPAVVGDDVVVAYSSGEIFSLRAENGRAAWSDVLAVPAQIGALPAIADIRGLPVIDKGIVYAISHSGRMAAIDLRSGERIWDSEIGGVNTPSVQGNMIFMIDNDNKLLGISRNNGKIVWAQELQRFKNPEDRSSDAVSWWGPVFAGGHLWAVNSLGEIVAFAPADGVVTFRKEMADAFFVPPVVVDGKLLLVDDDGDLIAMK